MPKLRLKQIRTDGGTQMRVGPRNQEAVREYADVLKEGGALPPVTVFLDGRDYWLSDGFHRYSAHMLLDWQEIEADVREGDKRDAILYAVGANASHGLRRSNQDKRRAVETLLKDEEWGKWSDREIARRSHTSAPLVARIRGEVTENSYSEPSRTFTTKHGTQATMQTSNIGQRPPAPPTPTPQPAAPSSPENHPEPDQAADASNKANTSVSNPKIPQTAPAPEQDAEIPPEPPLINEVAAPDEKVIKAEELYFPFYDPEPPSRTPAETEKAVKDIHNALERLMKHDRDGRGLLATPDPYTRSVRSLARHARDMLDEWLQNGSEQESKTITLDALN